MQTYIRWLSLLSLSTVALSACGETETTTQVLTLNNQTPEQAQSTTQSSAATVATNTPHPAELAARRYYEAIQAQDCSKAAALRPGYSEQRCQRIKQLSINEIRLDAAREDAAAVYIDITYQGNDNATTAFTGLLLAQKTAQGWQLQNDFKRYDQLTTSPEVFLNEYLPPANTVNAAAAATKATTDNTQSSSAAHDDSAKATSFLMGHFDPKRRDNFVTIENKYASRAGMTLQKEAYDAFKAMHAAAKQDGITLTIKSATRNFSYQRGIWEAKWNGDRAVSGQNLAKTMPDPKQRALKILQYSAMPGSSRHHWGTDIDLNSFNNSYFASGKGKREYDWLTQNAPNFGFCQTYTAKGQGRQTGYNEEKWHWSYLPLSKTYTQQARQLDNQQFQGFSGAATASDIDVVNNYVLGIDPRCL